MSKMTREHLYKLARKRKPWAESFTELNWGGRKAARLHKGSLQLQPRYFCCFQGHRRCRIARGGTAPCFFLHIKGGWKKAWMLSSIHPFDCSFLKRPKQFFKFSKVNSASFRHSAPPSQSSQVKPTNRGLRFGVWGQVSDKTIWDRKLIPPHGQWGTDTEVSLVCLMTSFSSARRHRYDAVTHLVMVTAALWHASLPIWMLLS